MARNPGKQPSGRKGGRPKRGNVTVPQTLPSASQAFGVNGTLGDANAHLYASTNASIGTNMNLNMPANANVDMNANVNANMSMNANANMNMNANVNMNANTPNTYNAAANTAFNNLVPFNNTTNANFNNGNAYLNQGTLFQNAPFTPSASSAGTGEHMQLDEPGSFDFTPMYTLPTTPVPPSFHANSGTVTPTRPPLQVPPAATQARNNAHNHDELASTMRRLDIANSDPAPIRVINRPRGQAGSRTRGFPLEPVMMSGIPGGDHALYKRIQTSTFHNAIHASINFRLGYRRQPPEKLAKVYKAGRREYPYLTRDRFPNDWAQNDMLKQLIQNVQKRLKRVDRQAALQAAAAAAVASGIPLTATAGAPAPAAAAGPSAVHAHVPANTHSNHQVAAPAAAGPVAGPSNINQNLHSEDSDDDDDDDDAMYNTH